MDANFWKLIESLSTDPAHIDSDVARGLVDHLDAFDRACRRTDARRKREGITLDANVKATERHGRMAIRESLKGLWCAVGVDSAALNFELRARRIEQVRELAAGLYQHREMIDADGRLTLAQHDRWTSPKN